MVTGVREVLGEVDQPLRVCAVEAVDRLVVVAYAEHAAVGSREQSHQQQMRGSQVLELVDQQHPAGALRGGPRATVSVSRISIARTICSS